MLLIWPRSLLYVDTLVKHNARLRTPRQACEKLVEACVRPRQERRVQKYEGRLHENFYQRFKQRRHQVIEEHAAAARTAAMKCVIARQNSTARMAGWPLKSATPDKFDVGTVSPEAL